MKRRSKRAQMHPNGTPKSIQAAQRATTTTAKEPQEGNMVPRDYNNNGQGPKKPTKLEK